MTIWLWVGFLVLIIGLLALDLGVFHRREHVIRVREATAWTAFWVALALVFNVLIYFMYEHDWLGVSEIPGHAGTGYQAALQFFTGYVIEKSLSLDNIFVIAVIFSYFGVPAQYQHRVLFWGILGALIMRGMMIAAGVALIQTFDWIVYVFGALLLLTAGRLLVTNHQAVHPEQNPLVRLARRLYPVTATYHGSKFLVREDGRRAITPMLLVLLMIESTDVLFAVDSIPAIFAVTRDPFIVFTSNVFAILGLRSLYFALAGLLESFRHIKTSLVLILAYVGVKMILSHHYPIPTWVSLLVIVVLLAGGIAASLLVGKKARLSAGDAASRPTGPGPAPSAGAAVRTSMTAAIGEQAWKHTRRVVVAVIGFSVVLIGFVLFFLPGPALVVIPVGLAILGTEFVWARRLLRRVKRGGVDVARKFGVPPFWERWTKSHRPRKARERSSVKPAPEAPS